MFNNPVLDVAIGLVFIYLLYSLLASTVNEFIAMIFAYRHRMLEKAIEQMLDGKNISYYWWDKLFNWVKWISAFDLLKEKSNLKSPKKDLKRKIFLRSKPINTKRTEDNTKSKEYIYRRKLNRKAELFAANVTNHPLYRRKSEDSFLFKKPAYLSSSAFSDILTDILANRRSEINALPILMNDIKMFVSNNLNNEHNKDLKSILNLYIEQANGDIQKFKLLIETWYDDTMERVSGWYKRQATKILFVIGLVLAISFNVSTIEIVRKLSTTKDLREAMAQRASTYVKQLSTDTNSVKKTSSDTDINQQVRAQLHDIQKLYKDSIEPVNMMMGLGWNDTIIHKNFIKGNVDPNKISGFNKFIRWLLPNQAFNGYYSSLSVLSATLGDPLKLIGFLITALAITLGAPFWFDLLNKFVNVRAGGNKPSENIDTGSPAANAKSTQNQKPATNSFA